MRNSISFIGVGNMGAAIIKGVLAANVFKPEAVTLFERDKEKCAPFCAIGCRVAETLEEASCASDTILLAVKPQQIDAIMAEMAPYANGKLIISIAAGVTVSRIEHALPTSPVIRVMPNTPLQVGAGVSALCRGNRVRDEDFEVAFRVFSASGAAFEADESLMNPVTALTSSSIAYFARFISGMCEWARENGFTDEKQILELVCRSSVGAAELLIQTDFTPKTLERAVTSPNGTTERAMQVFTTNRLTEITREAMDACLHRANELSKE